MRLFHSLFLALALMGSHAIAQTAYPDRPIKMTNSWFAILAPAGTPKEIAARLNVEVLKAVGDAEVRRKH
jgi:hypothetical protein